MKFVYSIMVTTANCAACLLNYPALSFLQSLQLHVTDRPLGSQNLSHLR